MKLCFATNNPHKLREISDKLGPAFGIVSPRDLGIEEELPENQDTLEGNSLEKATYLHRLSGMDCFADDTGLEVRALGGAPGVLSARYAGPGKDSADNIRLLLQKLDGKSDREARFRTVITLIINGHHLQFEGQISGTILEKPVGTKGFGYDPVFQPHGYHRSFAEMDLTTKNQISHRARAVEKLVEFLKNGHHG
jgi:XTP/dITP diphosphohydrolase